MLGLNHQMHDILLGTLEPGDEAVVRPWLREFLAWQLGTWRMSVAGDASATAIEHHIAEHGLIDRDWIELSRAAQNAANLVAVARSPSGPIGIVHVETRQDRYLMERTGVIGWVFVDQSWRRRGIGLRLLNEARGFLQVQGILAAEVFVTGNNAAAVHLYKKCGFHIVDHRMLAAIMPVS